MARAVLADPVAAGSAVFDLGRDGLEDRLDDGPSLRRAARHYRGAAEGALLPARDAGADEEEAPGLDVARPADRVLVVGVAAVDNEVAGREDGDELLDGVVDGLAGLDHDHHLARGFQRPGELVDGMAAYDLLAGAAAQNEVIDLRDGAVVNRDGKSLALHVEDQVLAHHRQADKPDVGLTHALLLGDPNNPVGYLGHLAIPFGNCIIYG